MAHKKNYLSETKHTYLAMPLARKHRKALAKCTWDWLDRVF